ncbi:WD40-repeat-containing domain protein [Apiospora arundinis]
MPSTPALDGAPPPPQENPAFHLIAHGNSDIVQAVAFNAYGDRCATGSVDGKIRVFNRHKDGIWRLCDHWSAHGSEILELQWLPPTVYPNLLASLGIEGHFKLWTEDNSAPPGRRFSATGKAAYETRSPKSPYRSFSIKHNEDTRHTYFALLAADGKLSVFESEEPETLADYTAIDEFQALPKPSRGEETCFKVRFDPNPEPCYAALRAGVPIDALGLVVSGLMTARVYRTRETITGSFGAATRAREFYQAAEITGHKGLVRDIAWAPGNFRGYDMIATACQDGHVRVFRLDTPFSPNDGKSWRVSDVLGKGTNEESISSSTSAATAAATQSSRAAQAHAHHSGIRAEIDKSGTQGDRKYLGQPGQVAHTVRELCKLENMTRHGDHRSPVWRVGFDDDGQILGSVGDEGKLMCYRQKPDGTWAKSSELAPHEGEDGGSAKRSVDGL